MKKYVLCFMLFGLNACREQQAVCELRQLETTDSGVVNDRSAVRYYGMTPDACFRQCDRIRAFWTKYLQKAQAKTNFYCQKPGAKEKS